jgi:hypothetical protein
MKGIQRKQPPAGQTGKCLPSLLTANNNTTFLCERKSVTYVPQHALVSKKQALKQRPEMKPRRLSLFILWDDGPSLPCLEGEQKEWQNAKPR